MAEVGNRRRIRIFRWIACGVATLVALLHLVHLGSDILFGPGGLSFRNVTAVQVALAALMTLYCVSLLMCWKWLKISGWLSLAAIGAFIGIVLPNGIISAWTVWWVGLLTVTMLSLPSLLLIAAAWFSRAPKTAAPAG